MGNPEGSPALAGPRRDLVVRLMEISNYCKEIVLGSLLGDGSLIISKNYRRARFEFRHSIVQKEYFFWKVKELNEISREKSFRLQPADGWSKNKKLHFGSAVSDFLTDIHRLTHQGNIFVIRRKWLSNLSAVSLLVWWLDDGSLVKNSRQGVFCTEGFKRHSIVKLSKYMKQTWDIETHVARRGKYYQLRIYSTEELKKFLRIILPHFRVKSMLPKVILLYKDLRLQKRWISEVVKLTNFSEKVVNKYYRQKRNRWKSFRE